jgi:hypothetical protein
MHLTCFGPTDHLQALNTLYIKLKIKCTYIYIHIYRICEISQIVQVKKVEFQKWTKKFSFYRMRSSVTLIGRYKFQMLMIFSARLDELTTNLSLL